MRGKKGKNKAKLYVEDDATKLPTFNCESFSVDENCGGKSHARIVEPQSHTHSRCVKLLPMVKWPEAKFHTYIRTSYEQRRMCCHFVLLVISFMRFDIFISRILLNSTLHCSSALGALTVGSLSFSPSHTLFYMYVYVYVFLYSSPFPFQNL